MNSFHLFYDYIMALYRICVHFGNFFYFFLGRLLSMERINQRTNHLVGQNIKRIRTEQKLRSTDVVAKLQLHGVEISTSTFSKVERGSNNPSVDLLIGLTKIFRCDFNAFFEM